MPSYKRPDIYTSEFLATSRANSDPSSSVAIFMGEHWRGPTVLQEITSWTEFVNHFGGFAPAGVTLTNPYLAYAVYAYFANGGGVCQVARVLGAGSPSKAYKTVVDRAGSPLSTLTISAVDEGTWGNNIRFDIVNRDAANGRFDLIVKYGGTTDVYIVERWLDLSMLDSDPRYIEQVVNFNPDAKTGSYYITVTDLDSVTTAPSDMPAVQSGTALDTSGGVDGNAPGTTEFTAAVTATTSPIDAVTAGTLMGINLPGVYTAAVVNAANSYAETRGDAFVVIDPQISRTPAQAVTYYGTLTASGYGALYYPYVNANDPASTANGATRYLPPGGFVLGRMARTDAQRGVFKAPAGLEDGKIVGVVGLERKLSDADLDTLNDSNVNAIRHIPGAGVCVMGARTLKKSTADKYVPVRRTLNYIKAWVLTNTRWAIFEPNDANLWGSLEMQVQSFLSGLWQQRGLRGTTPAEAFYVKCDGELNTPSVIASGEVRVEIGVALQYPAEFIVFRIGQWEGGQRVAEAA